MRLALIWLHLLFIVLQVAGIGQEKTRITVEVRDSQKKLKDVSLTVDTTAFPNTTDSRGKSTITVFGTRGHQVKLFVEKEGYQPQTKNIVLTDSVNIDILLVPADSKMTGYVRNASDLSGVKNAIIEIVGISDLATFTKPSGAFALSFNAYSLRPDTLVVQVSHPDFETEYKTFPGWVKSLADKSLVWADFELKDKHNRLEALFWHWSVNDLLDKAAIIVTAGLAVLANWYWVRLNREPDKSGQATIVVPK